MEPSAQTVDEVAEAVVTAVVGEHLLEKEHEPLLEPLADPWCVDEVEKDTRACENVCDCAMMAVAKVSPQVLKNLCSNKCIITFANVKEVNENLRDKILKHEVQFEKSVKELKNKLYEKDNEISSLKHEHSITKNQLKAVIETYQACKKELESTQITYEKCVESCKGYELMLEKQIKSNVKFGIGFRKNDQIKNTAVNESGSVEIIPSNKDGQEIKITNKNGNKIILEKPEGLSTFEEIEKYKFTPTWSDECDIHENFKTMDFSTVEGVKVPKAKRFKTLLQRKLKRGRKEKKLKICFGTFVKRETIPQRIVFI
ncbi:hypothetical protein HanHA89_Chr02g0050011 [Helianthus annuus]|nr:hypothetical protein HanHA89_Chr02g0050011 [Helianthus annuus]